ncbi:hypothetical protein HK105_207600 [Polyrhizophydium stewartii]|uniref:Anaphase-promoting complex subunit 4 WD40 domain-containing protein n=1 Tax=Polyrhizophydium stewartii TaxID=2732419 RepID=A0ABR4N0B7_9FUNG
MDRTHPHATTLCELNRSLRKCRHLTVSPDDDSALSQATRADAVVFPSIVVPAHILPADARPTMARPLATLPSKEPQHPVSALVQLLASAMLDDDGNMSSAKAESDLLAMLRTGLARITAPLRLALGMPSAEQRHAAMLESLGSGPVRSVAWHPFKQALALAHANDSVHIYDLSSQAWCPREPSGLVHEFQRGVSCAAWNPTGAAALAVGCSDGICLWRLQFDASASSISSASGTRLQPLVPADAHQAPQPWMTLLRSPHFAHVAALAWSPDGRLLVAGSASGPALAVFDVASERGDVVRQPGEATRELAFSHDGLFLLQAYRSGGIRIWETQTWDSVLVATKRPAHSIAWLPDSRLFVFALEGDARVGLVQMAAPAPSLETITAPMVRLERLMDADADVARRMGGIRQMRLSPGGDRALVLFERSPQVALFAVDARPLPAFEFIGFVRSPPLAVPRSGNSGSSQIDPRRADSVAFAGQFRRGALASIAWQSGRLSFVPMIVK